MNTFDFRGARGGGGVPRAVLPPRPPVRPPRSERPNRERGLRTSALQPLRASPPLPKTVSGLRVRPPSPGAAAVASVGAPLEDPDPSASAVPALAGAGGASGVGPGAGPASCPWPFPVWLVLLRRVSLRPRSVPEGHASSPFPQGRVAAVGPTHGQAVCRSLGRTALFAGGRSA